MTASGNKNVNRNGSRPRTQSKSRKRKKRKSAFIANSNYILAGGAVLLLILLIVLGVKGCGVSHKTPDGVVEALIKSGVEDKEKDMKKCYDTEKKVPKELQEEIDATIKYYKAHNVSKVKINDCEVLTKNKKYTYVYIRYNLVLENEQEYPCIATYMVKEKDNKYYVFAPSEITEEMSQAAADEYAKFMTTDTYKDYTVAYDTFIKKNPGYEERIAGKLA